MIRTTRLVAALAFALGIAQPAGAQVVPVIDATAIVHAIAQVQQTVLVLQQAQQAVTIARQNMQVLGGAGGFTNITAQIGRVNGLLNAAQATCTAARNARSASAGQQCNIQTQTAIAQEQQLGASSFSLQGLQRAMSGTGGGLAAAQANTATLVQLSTQLQGIQQQGIATGMQRQGDENAYAAAAHGPPAYASMFEP
jgi:hypothetical protein